MVQNCPSGSLALGPSRNTAHSYQGVTWNPLKGFSEHICRCSLDTPVWEALRDLGAPLVKISCFPLHPNRWKLLTIICCLRKGPRNEFELNPKHWLWRQNDHRSTFIFRTESYEHHKGFGKKMNIKWQRRRLGIRAENRNLDCSRLGCSLDQKTDLRPKWVTLELTVPTDQFSRQNAFGPFSYPQHCPLKGKSTLTRVGGTIVTFDKMPRVRFITCFKINRINKVLIGSVLFLESVTLIKVEF